MTDLRISNPPMFAYYMRMGMSNKEILDDATFEVLNRLYGLTKQQRDELGITDEFLDNENIRDMIQMERVKFTYDPRSSGPFPKYQISIDFDNNGLFSNLYHPNQAEVGFQPMRLPDKYQDLQYDNFKADFIHTKYKQLKSQLPKLGKFGLALQEELKQNPTADAIIENIMGGYMNLQSAASGVSDSLARAINESDMFPFNLISMNMSDNRFSTMIQDLQQEQILINNMKNKLGANYPNITEMESLMEESNYELLKANPFFDFIAKNEGGFFEKVYSPILNIESVGTGLTKETARSSGLYATLNDEGNYKYDPTIGYGFSLNDRFVKSLLTEKGYNIDNLLLGKESLAQTDAIDIFYNVANTKLEDLQSMFPINLSSNENALLAVGLVDLNFLSGFGEKTKSFIGPRMKEALNNYFNETDPKIKAQYLGTFSAYEQDGNGKDIHLGYKTSTKGYGNNRPTILQELYNDGLYYQQNGRGGYMHRFERISDLFNSWDQGIGAVNNLPNPKMG
jgi:hypothetical protein